MAPEAWTGTGNSDSGYYPQQEDLPIKPMYNSANTAQPFPTKQRRQVIQQIIHNNGSGNIMFSGN